MSFEGAKQGINSSQDAVVDYTFILESISLVLTLEAVLMDLILFCTNERTFVDIWVNFNV